MGAIGGLVSGAIGGVVGGVMVGETDLAGVDDIDNQIGQSGDGTLHAAALEEQPPTPVENGHGEAAPDAHDDNPAGDDVPDEMPEPIEDGIQENISEEGSSGTSR